jgi:hypothetical protein
MKIIFTKEIVDEAMKNGCKTVDELRHFINEYK